MADGFHIPLDPEQNAQLEAAAEQYGLSPADYAAALIEAGLTGAPPRIINPDPAIDHAIAEEAMRTGDTIPWPEFRARLRRFGGRDG
jgi:hypothetical protein